MEILKYLIANFNIDDDNDIAAIQKYLANNYDQEDCVEFANILVLCENLKPNVCQPIWDRL